MMTIIIIKIMKHIIMIRRGRRARPRLGAQARDAAGVRSFAGGAGAARGRARRRGVRPGPRHQCGQAARDGRVYIYIYVYIVYIYIYT